MTSDVLMVRCVGTYSNGSEASISLLGRVTATCVMTLLRALLKSAALLTLQKPPEFEAPVTNLLPPLVSITVASFI